MTAEHDVVAALGTWSAGGGPLYRRLAQALTSAAREGRLLPGQRLPAERALAEALAVSRATVVAAYEQLREAGLAESRRGSGTRIIPSLPAPSSDGSVRGGRGHLMFQRMIDGPGELISLSCSAMAGSEAVAAALREVVEADLGALLQDTGYHPRGLPELRRVLAEHYTRQGLPTNDEEILVTTGAHQALVLIAQQYLAPRRTVVVETPSWPGCLDVFQGAEAVLHPVPLDEEGPEPVALSRALATSPALLFVMPSYHNPTGQMMSLARRRRVGELAAQHGVPVIEDNAYAGLQHAEPLPPLALLAPARAEVLTVDSLGKAVWGGLRIGWVRGPCHIIDRLARRKVLADLGSPLIDQAVAARLVPRLEELVRARSDHARARMGQLEAALRDRLPDWTWRRPDGGSSLWVRAPGVDVSSLAQVALRHGVEIIPGSTMGPDGGYQDHLRIPFTFAEERVPQLMDALVAAVGELARHGPRDDRQLTPVV